MRFLDCLPGSDKLLTIEMETQTGEEEELLLLANTCTQVLSGQSSVAYSKLTYLYFRLGRMTSSRPCWAPPGPASSSSAPRPRQDDSSSGCLLARQRVMSVLPVLTASV